MPGSRRETALETMPAAAQLFFQTATTADGVTAFIRGAGNRLRDAMTHAPNNWNASGSFLYATTVVAFIIVSPSIVALAHDSGMGWSYPWECCHDHDCVEINEGRVHTSPDGYVIDGHFIVPQSKVRRSPDGHYHACFPTPDKLLCFFAPPMGS